MTEIPTCECHGVEMCWNRDVRCHAGGFWYCRIRQREFQRAYYAANGFAKCVQNAERYHRRRLADLEARLNGGG